MKNSKAIKIISIRQWKSPDWNLLSLSVDNGVTSRIIVALYLLICCWDICICSGSTLEANPSWEMSGVPASSSMKFEIVWIFHLSPYGICHVPARLKEPISPPSAAFCTVHRPDICLLIFRRWKLVESSSAPMEGTSPRTCFKHQASPQSRDFPRHLGVTGPI